MLNEFWYRKNFPLSEKFTKNYVTKKDTRRTSVLQVEEFHIMYITQRQVVLKKMPVVILQWSQYLTSENDQSLE